MAKVTKAQEKDRRARIEAMRKAEQARERRKSMLFVVLAVVVGLGLIAAAAIPAYLNSRDDPANKALSSFGVDAADADCGPVRDNPGGDVNNHVGPGTDQADITTVDYERVPPTTGPHYPVPAFPASEFYTERDRPRMEELVHNLEHGYTVVWHDDTVDGEQREALQDIATSAREKDPVGPGKFIVSAWDDAYGDFPEGKHVALSHWGADTGHRQLCGQVSGEVVNDFIEAYPFSDSPEPNGQ